VTDGEEEVRKREDGYEGQEETGLIEQKWASCTVTLRDLAVTSLKILQIALSLQP
jgi:hypothetical protein